MALGMGLEFGARDSSECVSVCRSGGSHSEGMLWCISCMDYSKGTPELVAWVN